jgi:hypothetical protein
MAMPLSLDWVMMLPATENVIAAFQSKHYQD